MKNQNIQPLHKREYKPKREPIPRTWFLSHGYTKADTRYTNGHAIWLHPKTNDVYSAYGKIKLDLVPKEKHMITISVYLRIDLGNGHILLARLKFLTFKGEIKKGETIDHIDGNTLNNDIHNLRAIPLPSTSATEASSANSATKASSLPCTPASSSKASNAWPNGKPPTQNGSTIASPATSSSVSF